MRLTICLTAARSVRRLNAARLRRPPSTRRSSSTKRRWTFTDKQDGKLQESIDADGNYIRRRVGGKHVDHGTAVMKDAKACFTSAMTKEGEICWTTGPVKIGHSMVTHSSKGQKLTVTRVKYTC